MKKWKGYEKGINLGGWFSQCSHTKERYETFITKEDVKRIADWGLDHVRVPVDYNLVEEKDGTYKEEGFVYIQRTIDWCEEAGLNMILDLHKTAGFSFDDGEQETGFFEKEEYQERFYRLWEEFTKRFGKYYSRLAFELLNEVTDQEYLEAWNRIAEKCIQRIRRIQPEIDILVGGYWNNSIAAIKDLALPLDEHIIYNFHCYDPLIFTHQGAPWVKGMPVDFRFGYDNTYKKYLEMTEKILPQQAVVFPEMTSEEELFSEKFFETLFAEAVQIAEERNVALYCGEYGVIDRAEPSDALKWYQAIHQVFEKYGIGRAAWSYREMDFGFTGEHFSEVLEQVIAYL